MTTFQERFGGRISIVKSNGEVQPIAVAQPNERATRQTQPPQQQPAPTGGKISVRQVSNANMFADDGDDDGWNSHAKSPTNEEYTVHHVAHPPPRVPAEQSQPQHKTLSNPNPRTSMPPSSNGIKPVKPSLKDLSIMNNDGFSPNATGTSGGYNSGSDDGYGGGGDARKEPQRVPSSTFSDVDRHNSRQGSSRASISSSASSFASYQDYLNALKQREYNAPTRQFTNVPDIYEEDETKSLTKSVRNTTRSSEPLPQTLLPSTAPLNTRRTSSGTLSNNQSSSRSSGGDRFSKPRDTQSDAPLYTPQQRRAVAYVPYSGKVDMDVKTGHLGPDFENMEYRDRVRVALTLHHVQRQRFDKMKQYAETIRIASKGRMRTSSLPPVDMEATKKEMLRQNRAKVLEYASSIPRPKVSPNKALSNSNSDPRDDGDDSELGPMLSELELLEMQHQRYREAVDSIAKECL